MEWVRCYEVTVDGSLLNQWFPNVAQQEVEEDLGSYDRTHTLPVTEAAQEEGEDEEEGPYLDRWKEGQGRFRR